MKLLVHIIIVLASIFCFQSHAHADCLACWKLKYVELELYNGESYSGYITWSKLWVGNSEQLYKKDYSLASDLCDTLNVYFDSRAEGLIVYEELFNTKITGSKVMVSTGQMDTLNLDQIVYIKSPNRKLNRYEGAGPIPSISPEQANLLKNQSPVASHKTAGWGLSDAYYFSYDENISKEDLIQIANNRTKLRIQEPKVILIEVHYD